MQPSPLKPQFASESLLPPLRASTKAEALAKPILDDKYQSNRNDRTEAMLSLIKDDNLV